MQTRSKIIFSLSMFIFGTIGIFRRFIPLPSGFVSMVRGFAGALFLCLFMLFASKKPDKEQIKKNLFKLVFSGAFMGLNWMLLFESYSYTSVATATLCYYMAPIFVLIASPFIFKEKAGVRNICCIIVSAIGMTLVSGVVGGNFSLNRDGIGVIMGLSAAVLYAAIILINKTVTGMQPYDKTVVQLLSAAVVMVPYVFFAENISLADFTPLSVVLLLTVGILHTGICYAGYFGSLDKIKASTVAVLSYIDPVVAVILSAILLKESMTVFGIIGAVLIIGSAIVSELPQKEN